MGRQRRTPKNGAISTKSPGTMPMNVAQKIVIGGQDQR
jgi:hypothetical protein